MTSLKRKLSLALPTLASALLILTPVGAAHATAAPAHSAASVRIAAVGTICESSLPSQADDTLELIDEGGPFPYPEDGEIFQNREHLLPSEPNGYYHEYTVDTPGSSDRGARRIITGQGGQDYYTSDHYESFKKINFSC
jgi:ribonuclease T1